MTHVHNSIPWVEKYRPSSFDNIVLSANNQQILTNIIQSGDIPNIMLYGPPGTGKTTTAVNFINSYQSKYHNTTSKELVIHLNASDDRGIDVIRNQVNQFVNSKFLFAMGIKFVILDEVDYMTASAQQVLKYMICSLSTEVRFILICNYISKIDSNLQNIFVKLRFNQLPFNKIKDSLKSIVLSEKVHIQDLQLNQIINLYKSDMRSMINFIQTAYTYENNTRVITDSVWYDLLKTIIDKPGKFEYIYAKIIDICSDYGINKYTCMRMFSYYIITNHGFNSEILCVIEIFVHKTPDNIEDYIQYVLNMFTKHIDTIRQ